MQSRLPLALLLSLAFLWLYGSFLSRNAPPPAEGGAEPPPGIETGVTTGGNGAGGDRPVGDVTATPPPATLAPVESAPERTVRFDAGSFESEWHSRGASLGWMRLTDYTTTTVGDEPLPLLDRVDGESGNFLLRDLSDRYGLERVHWTVTEETHDGLPRLVFTHRTADGLVFTRTITATGDDYAFELAIDVRNDSDVRTGNVALVLQSARGIVDEEAGSVFYGMPTALAVVRGRADVEVVRWSTSDLISGEERPIEQFETLLAAGAMTNYFTSVLEPLGDTDVRRVSPVAVADTIKLERQVQASGPTSEAEADRLRRDLMGDVGDNAAADLGLIVNRLDPGESQQFAFRVYSGPKAQEVAQAAGYAYLTPIIESTYGMMGWINRSLLVILRFFHSLVGNWGAAIIFLTILVRGILFPLNRRQQVSMAKYQAVMTKLKPQLDALKAKYKNNVRRYQQEQMELMKKEGARPPLFGCLIMFAQFPIWISLFQILGTSIELRQAGFVGWVDDLSRPDQMPFGFFGLETINLLPLLMAAATVVQMLSQPKQADPSQAQMQKIMAIMMPVIMLLFLYNYSSGLSLYIFTSSLLGIFEFQVIRRIWPVGASGPGASQTPPSTPPQRGKRRSDLAKA